MGKYPGFHAWVIRAFGDFQKPHEHEWVVDCPKCGAIKRFSMNPKIVRYNCFRCGGGHLMKFLLDHGVPHFDAMKLVEGEDLIDLGQFDESINQLAQTHKQIEEAGNSPEDIYRMTHGFMQIDDPVIRVLVEPYLRSRGFTVEYAKSWGLTYAHTGPYGGRLIIPCFDNGVLTYFQARSMFGQQPKYLNPSVPKGRVVFNADTARRYAKAGYPIYVFEGGFNAMSVGPNTVAVFGKNVSDTQLGILLDVCQGSPHIVIGFDHGATAFAHQLAGRMSMGRQTSVIDMPDERDMNTHFIEGGLSQVEDVLRRYTRNSDGFTM